MPYDHTASSRPPSPGGGGAVPRLVIGSNARDLSPGARALIAAADIVFCEADADSGATALIAPGTFIERVPAERDRAVSQSRAISRACKLAADGWRVVWVAAVDPAASFADCDQTGCNGAEYADIGTRAANEPQQWATAFNGLAG